MTQWDGHLGCGAGSKSTERRETSPPSKKGQEAEDPLDRTHPKDPGRGRSLCQNPQNGQSQERTLVSTLDPAGVILRDDEGASIGIHPLSERHWLWLWQRMSIGLGALEALLSEL